MEIAMENFRILKILTVLFGVLCVSEAIRFRAIPKSYARFPKWNACINASMSFDFKTNRPSGLLMYTDDNGTYDFFELMLSGGTVRLRLNIVDGRDGSVEFSVGRNMNDNRWHKLKITRNRMETTLQVDDLYDRKVAFGSDFEFGNVTTNSEVFFGGVPNYHFDANLKSLSLPSVMFESRFYGEIRNVIYHNCSCEPVRASMLEGNSVDPYPLEACEIENPCGDCLCISADGAPSCNCEALGCATGDVGNFYHLPMDKVSGNTVVNPSGLDSIFHGSPTFIDGALNKALEIDGQREWLELSGPGHRYECLGDLDRCPNGYTLGFWIYFNNAGDTKGVYLSNGGHNAQSYGIAMMYKSGSLEYVFRKRNGEYWKVDTNKVLNGRWYYITVTWKTDVGLILYVNGDLVDKQELPETRAPVPSTVRDNLFVIGRANDNQGLSALTPIYIDELKFWPEYKPGNIIKEIGPIYKYHLTMDQIEETELVVENLNTRIFGTLRLVAGKIRNAVRFAGDGGYVNIGNFEESCLGDVHRCIYGFTISFWIYFTNLPEFNNPDYYFASGPRGFNIFSRGTKLHATVQDGNNKWEDSFPDLRIGRWYFVEVTWSQEKGLDMYVDQVLAASTSIPQIRSPQNTTFTDFYVGRAGYATKDNEEFANAIIDDVIMHYGQRDTLLYLDFIQRGKPNYYHFGLDQLIGDRLVHPSLLIETYQNPRIVGGKIGNAIKLNGEQQYVDFGEQSSACLGNLDRCHHGATVGMWFRPSDFRNNRYFFSNGHNGLTLENRGRQVKVTAKTTSDEWEVNTDRVNPDQWHFLEMSWDRSDGLELYVDNQLTARDPDPRSRRSTGAVEDKFYLGRGNHRMERGTYGKGTFDELEYWYAPRKYLTSSGYLQREKPINYILSMDELVRGERTGYVMPHERLRVIVTGTPRLTRGVSGKALLLDGNDQYLNLGEHRDSCLGKLAQCHNGITISGWFNFEEFDENMYILSSGNHGIRLFHKDGYLYAKVYQDGKEWTVSTPAVDTHTWNLLDLSWDKDHGLEMYLNNTLVAHSTFRNVPRTREIGRPNFFVGRANIGDSNEPTRYGKFAVDDLQIWYGRRPELIAFDYMLRDNIRHEIFSMETERNGNVLHPHFTVTVANGARLVRGKIGRAISFDGNRQYLDLGIHDDKCFANIKQCRNGLTLSLWLKARQLEDNTYFLSSPTYSLFYQDGKLKGRFHENGRMWEVSTADFRARRWYKIDLSWTPHGGLSLYLNGNEVSNSTRWDIVQLDEPARRNVYVGRPSTDDQRSRYANAVVDELQYWYGPRDRALTSGQAFGGTVTHQPISLNRVIRLENGSYWIMLPTRSIRLYGGASSVQGQQGRAVRVNGKGQYLDLGEGVICDGNIANCPRGFTLRFYMKPERLLNNMYFLDSFPVSLFYRDGKLYSTVQTPTRSWTVSTPGFNAGEWQLIDLSWHPQSGLTMYLNREEASHQTFGTPQDEVRNWNTRTYVGRALTDMVRERYADAIIERMDVYNAQRGYLELYDLIEKTITTPRPTLTTKATTRWTPRTRPTTTTPTPTTTRETGPPSRIFRFYGDGYVHYDFSRYRNRFPQMYDPANLESFSMSFTTEQPDGLLWMDNRDGQLLYILMKNGVMTFVIEDGTGRPQYIPIRPRRGEIDDWRWHVFKVERNGRNLNFYIDNDLVERAVVDREFQFINTGDVYLGSSPDNDELTNGYMRDGYVGALGQVFYEKRPTARPNEIINVNLLSQPGRIIGPVDTNGSIDRLPPTRRTPKTTTTTTQRPTTTRPPVIATTPEQPKLIINTMSITESGRYIQIPGYLDLRYGGSIKFRFKTMDERGVLFFSQRGSTRFVATEIFDGKLYFVYDFGYGSKRVKISDSDVNTGVWQEVEMVFNADHISFKLNGLDKRIPTTSRERFNMYLSDGIYVGGIPQSVAPSWYIWNRNDGYLGCFGDLQLKGVGTSMGLVPSSQFERARGLQNGCVPMTRQCITRQCGNGTCYEGLNSFICDCAGTGFTGTRCDESAIIGSFEGNKYGTYYYTTTQKTHFNDISLRFRSQLSNAFLFQTMSDIDDGFIRAELVDGRVKVTVRVNGKDQVYYTGTDLSLDDWHNLNIRRRANELELWVDDDAPQMNKIDGENFYINIDKFNIGAYGDTGVKIDGIERNFIGYMQNVFINGGDVFRDLKKSGANIFWLDQDTESLNYYPVTFLSRDVYSQLPTLNTRSPMRLSFKFKTQNPDGIILYNKGKNGKFIATELVDGNVRFAFNNGYKTSNNIVPKKVDDNNWHLFEVKEIIGNGEKQYEIRVDDFRRRIPIVSSGSLELTGPLFIGGISGNMLKDNEVTSVLRSDKGFLGCMASTNLNGGVYDLRSAASSTDFLQAGCVEIRGQCPDVNPCLNNGICVPGITTYSCDCTMTAWTGQFCNEYPDGLYFGKNGKSGVLYYTFPVLEDHSKDSIAMAFMTDQENGLLMRLESGTSNEFVELAMEDGYIVARYNTGNGEEKVTLGQRKYNDGRHHVLRFIRSSGGSTLTVDGVTVANEHSAVQSLLNKVQYVYMGGFRDGSGSIMNGFNGIIGGAYWNGYPIVDLAYKSDSNINWFNDVEFINKNWKLIPQIIATPPPVSPLPPNNGPFIVPADIGGGGIVNPGGLGSVGSGGPDVVGIGGPGGSGGIAGSMGGPVTGALVGGGGAAAGSGAGGASAARAGAVAGTILGTGAFLASLMWALWKFKPGTGGLGGGGGGGGGGGAAAAVNISSPTAAIPLLSVGAGAGGGGGGSAVSAGGGQAVALGGGGSAVQYIGNGGAGSAGAGGGTNVFSSYYTSSSAVAGSGGSAGYGSGSGSHGAGYDSATLRATGTFSNTGTSIGGSPSPTGVAGRMDSTTNYTYGGYGANSLTYSTMGGGSRGGSVSAVDGRVSRGGSVSAADAGMADYDLAPGVTGGGGTMVKGSYSSSTLASSYNYQVQNVRTVKMNRDSVHQMVSYGTSGSVTPGAAGDEVRVDCCLMAADGRSVVTGSTLGPPQVWDMQTGDLLRIMKGDTVGSTNLHLACNDRLLVGAVHADLEINEYSTRKGVTNKKLQIWDFTTGKPLEMGSEEICSGLCVMSDPDKVVFGRSEKFGNATSIIVWDLLGNQPIKEMYYDAPVGNNDYLHFLKLSQNDRYCVAGFTNTFDNYAEFVIFDMTLTSYNIVEPSILRLDANPECTVILPHDEAVTGLKNGDLVVWSLRTGQPNRQLLSKGGVHAHSKEVKALDLSSDNRYLVSASADGTLKVWDMQSERDIHTLSAHSDEVWCVTISPDNEIVVSGSRDGTIRLWRMRNGTEICAFNTGVDVFYVTMSHDKGTIVALGDKFGARKLIMLQVVRSKIRREISS